MRFILTIILIAISIPEVFSACEFFAMYVCLCNSVTDRAIRQSVQNGVSSLLELRKELGVASRCGQCACLAQEILEETQSANANAVGYELPYAIA